jgi:hypothetical protein
MKLTLYNDQYEFSKIFDEDYIKEYNLHNESEFDMPVSMISTSHPFAYGWLETIYQSDLLGPGFSDNDEYLFIKFVK